MVNHAFGVANGDVFALHAQSNQQVQAGDGGRTRAGADEIHLADVFAYHAQGVQYGGGGDDGGAVLVVVENGDVAAFAKFFLDVEAFRCFDVFEIDAAEGGFQRCDDLNQFAGIGFVDFDVEYVDVGKFFEQYAFAFHHGFACQRADVAQTQNRGTVGNDGHEIAFGGVFVGVQRIGVDFHARCGHARRIGQRQVVLSAQRLGGRDLDFAGIGVFVKAQCGFFD